MTKFVRSLKRADMQMTLIVTGVLLCWSVVGCKDESGTQNGGPQSEDSSLNEGGTDVETGDTETGKVTSGPYSDATKDKVYNDPYLSLDEACARFLQAFEDCGYFTDGDVSCDSLAFYHFTDCDIDCFIDEGCNTLQDFFCGSSVTISCACPSSTVKCDNGDSISVYEECDGIPDCSDGSDEFVNCPVFACASGDEWVSEMYECDGEADCEDGSDEHTDCEYFVCNDGMEIALSWECDFWPDCDDGEDEHEGCASLGC